MPIVKDGLSIWVRVKGFQDARSQLYHLIRAGIVKCGLCDQPATHVYWQDQAEWYEHCDAHYDDGEQWTGSTRWSGNTLSVAVIPDKAKAWLESLPADERTRYHAEAYDSRNLYDLLPEWGSRDTQSHKFHDDPKRGEWYWEIEIYPLTNGEFAYQISSHSPSFGMTYDLIGTFDSADQALAYARTQDKEWPERFRLTPAPSEDSSSGAK